MANGEKPTEKEHFIPRMYLRGFSEVKESGKALIWQFNLKTMQQTPVQVDVQGICFEKNLGSTEKQRFVSAEQKSAKAIASADG